MKDRNCIIYSLEFLLRQFNMSIELFFNLRYLTVLCFDSDKLDLLIDL